MSTEPRIPRPLERAPDFTPVCTQEFIEFARRADLDQKVSQAYGLVHEAVSDTATVRAVFVIDPKQNIRATVHYPMQLGRKVEELVQVYQALRTIDDNRVSAPANWKPGEPVVVSAPVTLEGAPKRTTGGRTGLRVETWYLAKKELAGTAK
jgi:peroxiredoxin 2/4